MKQEILAITAEAATMVAEFFGEDIGLKVGAKLVAQTNCIKCPKCSVCTCNDAIHFCKTAKV